MYIQCSSGLTTVSKKAPSNDVKNAVAIHAVNTAQTFSVLAHGSAFGSAGRNTFDKRALGQKKEHQDRTNHQGGRTHQEVPRGGAQAGHEQLQAKGQRELIAVGQEDEWSDKVVPHKHEVQQATTNKAGVAKGSMMCRKMPK